MARPREFDRTKALRQAMEAFWELGYEGTSTAALVERLGIGRSSLYAAFGSKDELYAEAMDSYIRDLRGRVIGKLRAEGPAMDVLKEFFLGVAERGAPNGERLRCCMVVRACLSGTEQSPAIRTRIKKVIAELDDAFHDLLQRARDEGSLGRGSKLRDSARFLTTTFQALNVATLAGRNRRELREIIRKALGSLDT
jgi:TetR/AcrR family transcriptional repressor of nem operon